MKIKKKVNESIYPIQRVTW